MTAITSRLVVIVLLGSVTAALGAREHGGHYTAERLANARQNCETLDWAKAIREKAVDAAAPWLARSDEELWSMVPGQDLPRTIDVTMDRNVTKGPKRLGCLVCGDKIDAFGNYPYEPDFDNKPWKLTCPSCKTVFPTNDFGKYYASGIDGHGLFDPKKADRSLLFNAEHPEKNDPLHTFGVDDGFGYVDKDGRSHKFVGYYVWKYWRNLFAGYHALADAFVYTGDKRYAHKAAVLFDRLADVYPAMDWKPYAERGWYHSDGNRPAGKIEGSIWECQLVSALADDYDKILSGTVGDADLYAFLKNRAERYHLSPKGTRDQFVANVDDGLLRTVYKAVLSGQIRGNEGMHQRAVTACALALDTQPETSRMLDWLFAPDGGAVPGLMLDLFDRDGISNEAAPGYALFWGQIMTDLAVVIGEYPAYTAHNIFRDFPSFRATFLAAWRLCALGTATPNIGDTGTTGGVARVGLRPDQIATGYRFTRDPDIAIAAYRANGSTAKGLGRDIFSKDPDVLAKEIEKVGKAAGPRPVASSLMTGFNLATLESTAGDHGGTALTCSFGRTSHHAHPDQLNFDLLAFGNWLAPDHGYPEFATNWPSRNEWTNSTISHNLVVVDGEPQRVNWGGRTRLFKSLAGLTAFQASAVAAYPDTKEYARTLLLIDTPDHKNAYAVDLFRVVGGHDHVLSFHGPPGAVTPTIELVAQPQGTYAGADVPFGPRGVGKFPVGYSYLYNVRRNTSPPASFSIDYKAATGYRTVSQSDDVHLRFHSLTPCNDVALADADPPQNKPGNPRRLPYALLHRTADASTFVSVLEPYRNAPFIKAVTRLGQSDTEIAIKIDLADGSTDYVLANSAKVDGGPSLNGALAFVHLSPDGQPASATLLHGSDLTFKDLHLTATPALTGKVVKMNKNLDGGGVLWVDAALPTDGSLAGQYLHVDPASERDACYQIVSAEKDGDLTKIYCGPISFVRGYAGPSQTVRGQKLPKAYDKGYLYDFDEGARFTIPTHATWQR